MPSDQDSTASVVRALCKITLLLSTYGLYQPTFLRYPGHDRYPRSSTTITPNKLKGMDILGSLSLSGAGLDERSNEREATARPRPRSR